MSSDSPRGPVILLFALLDGKADEVTQRLVVRGDVGDQAPWVSMTTDKKIIASAAGGGAEDLRFLANLAESGRYRPVIDRRYPFEQAVEAHRYVDTGRKRGNVVLTP